MMKIKQHIKVMKSKTLPSIFPSIYQTITPKINTVFSILNNLEGERERYVERERGIFPFFIYRNGKTKCILLWLRYLSILAHISVAHLILLNGFMALHCIS